MHTKEFLLALNPNIIPTMEMFQSYLASARYHYPDNYFIEKCVEPQSQDTFRTALFGSTEMVRRTIDVRDLYGELLREIRVCAMYEEYEHNPRSTLVSSKAGTFLFLSDRDVTDHVKYCLPKLMRDQSDRLKISVLGYNHVNAEIFPRDDQDNLSYDHYRDSKFGKGISSLLENKLPLDQIDKLPIVLDAIRNNKKAILTEPSAVE